MDSAALAQGDPDLGRPGTLFAVLGVCCLVALALHADRRRRCDVSCDEAELRVQSSAEESEETEELAPLLGEGDDDWVLE